MLGPFTIQINHKGNTLLRKRIQSPPFVLNRNQMIRKAKANETPFSLSDTSESLNQHRSLKAPTHGGIKFTSGSDCAARAPALSAGVLLSLRHRAPFHYRGHKSAEWKSGERMEKKGPNNQSASAASDNKSWRMNSAKILSIYTNFDVPVIREASCVEHVAPIGSRAANRTFQ